MEFNLTDAVVRTQGHCQIPRGFRTLHGEEIRNEFLRVDVHGCHIIATFYHSSLAC